MKTLIKFSLFAAFALAVLPLAAQPHLKEAFEKFIASPDVTTSRISNQITNGGMTGKLEIYMFSLQENDRLLTKLLDSFKEDADLSYSYIAHEGTTDKKEPYQIYKDGNNTIVVGNNADDYYRLFCIMADPNDSDNNYRYCYAVEWKTADNKTTGRAIKSYMPRPQKAKKKAQTYYDDTKDYEDFGNNIQTIVGHSLKAAGDSLQLSLDQYDLSGLDLGFIDEYKDGNTRVKVYKNGKRIYSEESFLTQFNFLRNRYKKFASNDKSTLPQSYSTQILSLCRKAPKDKLSERMINQCIKSIKDLQDITQDDFIRAIFDEAIDALK